jgi:hypothetical protein
VSDTPRTDAFEALPDRPINWWDFARELERENAALRVDKERLDWLEKYGATPICSRAAIDAARKEARP